MDYSERLMRAALADLPDGEGTSRISATATASPTTRDGNDAPFWIRMRVTSAATASWSISRAPTPR